MTGEKDDIDALQPDSYRYRIARAKFFSKKIELPEDYFDNLRRKLCHAMQTTANPQEHLKKQD